MKEVTLHELYEHLSYKAGEAIKFSKLHVDKKRKDEYVELSKPLQSYDDRVFWYAGLLYGFCRLDMSITERFRADSGLDFYAQNHVVKYPLCVLPWFPEFTRTNVAYLLQSSEKGRQTEAFFKFVSEQVIVDYNRHRVWKVSSALIEIPDPFLLEKEQKAQKVSILFWLPYRWDIEFKVRPGVTEYDPVQLLKEEKHDDVLRRESEQLLSRRA